MTLDDLPVRDDLRGQAPYGAPQIAVTARMNVNENPFPPSDALVADIAVAVANAAADLNRYPDRDAVALRGDLAQYIAQEAGVAVTADQVWAANGSNEIMHQVMLAFGGPGRTALGFTPTYSMYPEYCRDTFTEYVTVERRDDFTVDVHDAANTIVRLQPDIVLLASPNNPTGTPLDANTIRAVLDVAPGMVVIDEAYAEFRRVASPSACELLDDHPRLIVTRTMSKAFALAGARVGYLIASAAVVQAVQLVRLPYHLSAITQAVARAALAHADELQSQVALLRGERDSLLTWLRSEGWEAVDSDANFILFGRFADRHAVWQGLLDHGVLIRETGPSDWLRVSIGTPDENALFRNALLEVTR